MEFGTYNHGLYIILPENSRGGNKVIRTLENLMRTLNLPSANEQREETLIQLSPLLQGGWLESEPAEIAPLPLIFHSCCRCSPEFSVYLWQGSFPAAPHVLAQTTAEFTARFRKQ